MKFVDYTFSKAFDGNIIFDPELTADKLGVKSGDCFEVKINNEGVIILQKKQYNE